MVDGTCIPEDFQAVILSVIKKYLGKDDNPLNGLSFDEIYERVKKGIL